jgi:hypothetical protein
LFFFYVGGLILVPATEFAQVTDGVSSSSKQGGCKGGGTGEGKGEDEGEAWWQFKGEGKGGSLGLPVGSNGIGSTIKEGADALTGRVIPPAPKANTNESVKKMFDDGYYKFPETPFWDGKNMWDVVRGTHVLWKNVPRGKKGHESTKTEVFHGECHGWKEDEVIVS